MKMLLVIIVTATVSVVIVRWQGPQAVQEPCPVCAKRESDRVHQGKAYVDPVTQKYRSRD